MCLGACFLVHLHQHSAAYEADNGQNRHHNEADMISSQRGRSVDILVDYVAGHGIQEHLGRIGAQ